MGFPRLRLPLLGTRYRGDLPGLPYHGDFHASVPNDAKVSTCWPRANAPRCAGGRECTRALSFSRRSIANRMAAVLCVVTSLATYSLQAQVVHSVPRQVEAAIVARPRCRPRAVATPT